MGLKVRLKRSWLSPRGKLFPPDTIFVFRKRISKCEAEYDYSIYSKEYGTVKIHDDVFLLFKKTKIKEPKKFQIVKKISTPESRSVFGSFQIW